MKGFLFLFIFPVYSVNLAVSGMSSVLKLPQDLLAASVASAPLPAPSIFAPRHLSGCQPDLDAQITSSLEVPMRNQGSLFQPGRLQLRDHFPHRLK